MIEVNTGINNNKNSNASLGSIVTSQGLHSHVLMMGEGGGFK